MKTISSRRHRSIGADDVIDYTREDFADGKRRFDLSDTSIQLVIEDGP